MTFLKLIGTIGVTFFGNVPLNNTLDAVRLNKISVDDLKLTRSAFESSWNNLNLVRTLSSIVALVLLLVAALKNNTSVG
ncbi:MAG: DUF1772 domain-containing protein [Saprospiraceae bacterium]|uniref:DUF1772 domain-containing protein n=1 Tax=Candidatus Brachybacter algidus TaxID=2982024 RepID=UPI001B48B486|nr:DUF1772 domain-containing protein [Candidatus Brachybacter algidus]MBP7305735.1 DUF1772 domain-containing protein [Saprospiraceae bacterium]MBK6374510.1 DUF1772 domain-containing protein [Candidatus Brachybacter algidus]MBK6449849.1 DUF1772 domain-containing protein [Candidatus Brachybacter algidus]MBK8355566.1 DUF1772 domain-containing protein [Candidatus Brachybacter algidus]MBK8841414.1 DUF1772 domain-containing protein [Candidatus Brachybacter algidus]